MAVAIGNATRARLSFAARLLVVNSFFMNDVEFGHAVAAEERRSGAASREGETMFRELLELAPDAVVVGDADHRVTDVNAAACKLFGRTREEFVGKTLPGFVPEEGERFALEAPSIPGLVHMGEWQVKRQDGTLVSIEVSIKALPDGRKIGFIRDVTERKRAERERDESLRWMRAVLDQSPVGLVLLQGPQGDQVQFNSRAQQMLGRPEATDEQRAKISTLDGQLLDPDQFPGARALRGERIVATELLVPNAAGSSTPIAASAGPILCTDGTVIGAVVAFEDITARKELERLRAEWSSVVAHDLRQPISTIMLAAPILGRTRDEAKRVACVELVSAAAKRLNRMVGDLMDLSRLEAHRLELVRRRVDVPALVAASIDRVALQAPERAFDVRTRGRGPDADADPDRIAQVMDNLLTNAMKYGKGRTPIVVSLSWEDGEVVVAVSNEGPPLTSEDLSHLFERFQRTASAKGEGIEGVGLGLYITRSLVEAHGGHITAESTPAGVTTFRFTLPVAHD
jgi:PAS domain S-box-containing protein